MKIIGSLYNYRELLKTNIKKEIRGKYKGSFLGVLWSFINPLLTTLVYAIIFPYLMRNTGQKDYLIFLIVAIIPWTFFSASISQGGMCIRNEANIIKKVYFPREILPISVVLSGLINFFISCVIVIAFLLGRGVGITPFILITPIIAIIQASLTLGIIFIISSINVYVKDIEYIVNFVVQMLFYGTPILYNLSTIDNAPSWIVNLVNLNPMTHIINAYRDVMYYQQMPGWQSLGIVFLLSVVLVFVGYKIFKKLEKGFVEEL